MFRFPIANGCEVEISNQRSQFLPAVRDLIRKSVECVRGDALRVKGVTAGDRRAVREHPLCLAAIVVAELTC